MKHAKKNIFVIIFLKKNTKDLKKKMIFSCTFLDFKIVKKKLFMKFNGQSLVNFLDHTNMQNYH